VAQKLGVDLCVISSNGAVTRSLTGARFHRDLLPVETCREMCASMDEFRGHLVVTFDKETKGSLVSGTSGRPGPQHSPLAGDEPGIYRLCGSRGKRAGGRSVQAMYCGTISRMEHAQQALAASPVWGRVNVLKTEYPERDLCMVDVLNRGCSKGHALERWANHRALRGASHGHRRQLQ